MRSRLNKSSNDMLEEVGSCHAKVLSQLKLDVEVIWTNTNSGCFDDIRYAAIILLITKHDVGIKKYL